MSDTDYDDYDGECQHCAGEGRVAGTCIDGCCAEQDDPYCEYCSHRCDHCNPPTPQQVEEGNKLRQILADALSSDSNGRVQFRPTRDVKATAASRRTTSRT